jgi:hypothetical protein
VIVLVADEVGSLAETIRFALPGCAVPRLSEWAVRDQVRARAAGALDTR